MKTYQYIFVSAVLFVILFYEQEIALNLSILGLFLTIILIFKTPTIFKNKRFKILSITSLLSCFAFAWFGDFPSFLALVSSLLLLAFFSKNKKLKPLFLPFIIVVNVFTFICRFFAFEKWLPKRVFKGSSQKIFALVFIPLGFLIAFFVIYSAASNHFASLFSDYELDVNLWEVICLFLLGTFLAFNFFNYSVERLFYKNNHLLSNDFTKENQEQKPTFAFLDINLERQSGVMTFVMLNILLVFFIITYNYEQFYEIKKTPVQLSEETHERVAAVIISILMAVGVIMFYFKSAFNFDSKAKYLKISAKIWIFLNLVLVLSTVAKNSEYIINYGLTYKRLGVYAFLILSCIGLIIAFFKIVKQKTNAYLFNSMIWFFYATILGCSFINWGGIITSYNLKTANFNLDYHEREINFNENQLLKYAEIKNDNDLKERVLSKIKEHKSDKILSRNLYYECFKTK